MKVQKIWAELSAKAQEVSQESTELSEELELSLDSEMKRANNLASALKTVSKAFNKEILDIESKIEKLRYNLDTGGMDKAYIQPSKQMMNQLEKAGLTGTDVYRDLKNYLPVFSAAISSAEKLNAKLKSI